MADKGPLLFMNQFLGVNDYLTSTDAAFKAYMQNDGNFVVYNMLSSGQWDPRWATNTPRGIGPQYNLYMQNDGNLVLYEGPPSPKTAIWASNVHPGVGPAYTLHMQDDGNLVVYEGGNAIWATNTPWSLAGIVMSNVVYDTSRAVMSSPQLIKSTTQDVVNKTNVQQSQTFNWDIGYTEKFTWSVTAGIKVGQQAQITAGKPEIVQGQMQISQEASFSITLGGEIDTEMKYAGSVPVIVPPKSTVQCVATVSTVQVSVPYSANPVLFTLTDGKQLQGVLNGPFQGTLGYLLQTTFTPL